MNRIQREESSILKTLLKIGWFVDNKSYPSFRREYRKINRMNLDYARQTM